MARRSPTNPRYQKDAKVGSTRRSASSAKPKRPAGEMSGAEKPGPAKGKLGLPTSPEIKKWRKIWYALFAGALAAAGSIFIQPLREAVPSWPNIALGVEVSLLGAAIYIDMAIIRKLRKELVEQQKKKG